MVIYVFLTLVFPLFDPVYPFLAIEIDQLAFYQVRLLLPRLFYLRPAARLYDLPK